MTRPPRARLLATSLATALAAVAGQAQGSGFAIVEQSVTGLGNAFAGGAASAEDASTVFYNPAGLTRLQGTHYVAGLNVIAPSTKFSGSAAVGPFPVAGDNGGQGGVTGLVPNFYYARDLNNTTRLGVGINAPFGLATDYGPNWVGRYHAVKSDLKTLNINPAVAFKLGHGLSLGAGVDLQYIRAELTNAVDFGVILGGAAATGTADGFAAIKGDDWSWGYNLGLLYEVDTDTRLGVAYRSAVKHKLTGTADFTGTPAPLAAANQFVDTSATAKITLPETVSFSLWHDINPRLALMGDATWTRWSRFKELRVSYGSSQDDTVQPEQWDNSWRYSLGLTYRYSDKWSLRTGVAYDETPIPSATLRTPRIPGNNRSWLAFGATYRPAKNTAVDIGYAHLFVANTPIDSTAATGARLVGHFDSHVDILSAQLQWTFN